MKAGAIKIKSRTPKKPTEYTTKMQLQKMVADLENEISDILIEFKKSEDLRQKLEMQNGGDKIDNASKQELEDLKLKLMNTENELQKEKSNVTKDKGDIKNINNKLIETDEKLKDIEKKKTKLEQDKEKLQDENVTLMDRVKELNTEISKLSVT